jgi:hypothetical protein
MMELDRHRNPSSAPPAKAVTERFAQGGIRHRRLFLVEGQKLERRVPAKRE